MSEDLLRRYASRKFGLALLVIGITTYLVIRTTLPPALFADILIWVVGTYCGANVAQDTINAAINAFLNRK